MASFELTQVHHVQVAIPRGGEDAARAFWCGLLGMTEVAKPAALASRGGCWFRAAATGRLEIHAGVEEPFAPARKAHPGIAVDGVDDLAERLAGAGVSLQWSTEVPGPKRFHTEDPFGNRLEFLDAAAT